MGSNTEFYGIASLVDDKIYSLLCTHVHTLQDPHQKSSITYLHHHPSRSFPAALIPFAASHACHAHAMQLSCPSFETPATQLLPLLRATLRAAAALLCTHSPQHSVHPNSKPEIGTIRVKCRYKYVVSANARMFPSTRGI